jgi:hypothetical protein
MDLLYLRCPYFTYRFTVNGDANIRADHGTNRASGTLILLVMEDGGIITLRV